MHCYKQHIFSAILNLPHFDFVADATNSNAVIESSLDEESSPPQSAELEAQKSFLSNFDKNWTSLQGALRSSSSIEPFLIDCMQDEETVEADAVEHLEGEYCLEINFGNLLFMVVFSADLISCEVI